MQSDPALPKRTPWLSFTDHLLVSEVAVVPIEPGQELRASHNARSSLYRCRPRRRWQIRCGKGVLYIRRMMDRPRCGKNYPGPWKEPSSHYTSDSILQHDIDQAIEQGLAPPKQGIAK